MSSARATAVATTVATSLPLYGNVTLKPSSRNLLWDYHHWAVSMPRTHCGRDFDWAVTCSRHVRDITEVLWHSMGTPLSCWSVPGCAIWPAPSGATRSIWAWSVWRFSLRMSPLLANFIYSGGYEQFTQLSWHCPGWWSGRVFRVKFTEDSLKLDAVTGAGESMHIR